VKFADFLEKCPRAGLDWIHKHAYSCAEHNINHERCGVCIENCYKNINQNKKEGKLMAERKSLDKLNVGESGNIVFISDSIASRKKFADLGVIKGTFLKVEKIAPLGDPIDVKIKRHHLSFRKSEAANIIIEFKK
jgi:Fe2+ transport system protein FeoA